MGDDCRLIDCAKFCNKFITASVPTLDSLRKAHPEEGKTTCRFVYSVDNHASKLYCQVEKQSNIHEDTRLLHNFFFYFNLISPANSQIYSSKGTKNAQILQNNCQFLKG